MNQPTDSTKSAPHVQVTYGIGPEARRVLFLALGTMDPGAMPPLPTFPGIEFVPHKGDVIQWPKVGEEHRFIVEERIFRFDDVGNMQIVLAIDLLKAAG